MRDLTKLPPAKIDILKWEETNGIFTVDYWDENCENNSQVQLMRGKLLQFIVDNEMNVETFFNYLLQSLEHDGLDERVVNPVYYLEENTTEVLQAYIQYNS